MIEGIKGSREVYDGQENKIHPTRLDALLKEITEVRESYRAEFLDAIFGEETITYHKLVNGKFQKAAEPLDEDTLMDDKQISLEDWVENHTSQGLPRKNVKRGSLYYWSPVDGRVAGFRAYSDRAGLVCNGDPRYSNSSLGVRAAREKKL